MSTIVHLVVCILCSVRGSISSSSSALSINSPLIDFYDEDDDRGVSVMVSVMMMPVVMSVVDFIEIVYGVKES